MEGIAVSIDRIVIDFTGVYWDFFNPFMLRLCHYFGVQMYTAERGFRYHININTGKQFLHISYQLVISPKSRKHTLRIEAYPHSLVHFKDWLMQIQSHAKEVLFVRCDVAFDIPRSMNEVFTMSLKGRKLRPYLGTRYYNGAHQRQQNGYCRVYDKKAELEARKGKKIEGELTRMEIVYAPKKKIPLEALVQFPPQFANLYFCAVIQDMGKFKPKVAALVQQIQDGQTMPQSINYYYRQQVLEQMQSQQVIDLDSLVTEYWEKVITIPCAVLVSKVSKVPLPQ